MEEPTPRERARRARELERAMRELDDLDRREGLGAWPPPAGGRPPRRWERGRERARERRRSGAPASGRRRRQGALVPLGLALAIVAAMVAFAPGAEMDAARRLLGLGPDRLGAAPDAPQGGSYSFLVEQAGRPVGYDPCRPVRYQVNPQGAPPQWRSLVSRSIASVEQATGLRFEDDGTTDARDFFRRRTALLQRPLPVLIGWAPASEIDGLEGDVAGLGGSTTGEPTALGRVHLQTGSVVLDQDAFARMARDDDARTEMEGVLTHELGHVVGLGHVDDPGELMNATYLGQRGFGPGDLAGLAILGKVPCG